MNQPQTPDFDQIDGALRRSGASMGAAELHGALCGMLSVEDSGDGQARVSQLLAENNSDHVTAGADRDLMAGLHDETLRQLRDPEFGFHLLLPDDSQPLSLRAEALGDWCNGFLAGLGLAGVKRDQNLPEGVDEILRDFVEIAKVNFDVGDGDEEDETAYMELVEYIRMGVLVIHQEFHPGDSQSVH
ncbi:MAG: UPF0149 family protein [Gammaproteobacteria bacterium]